MLLRASFLRSTSASQNVIRRGLASTAAAAAAAAEGVKKTGAGYGNVTDQMMTAMDGRELFTHTQAPQTCSIIGAPMTYGQPFAGTDTGPTLLRQAGLREMLSSLGWRVEDLPDLSFDPQELMKKQSSASLPLNARAKNAEIVCRGSELVFQAVYDKLSSGNFPLILGGDHSIGIGSLAGVLKAYPDTGVLWIDAHADLNTPHISGSGNMHGMPVGLHLEGMHPPIDPMHVPGLDWVVENQIPKLKPDSIVYVGLRDVDAEERRLIRSLGIRAYTMHEIDRYGIGKVMEMALDHLLKNNPTRRLHLSYDIDAVDPLLAPATGTAVRGGLAYREAHYVAEIVAYTGNLASAEIVELNPSLSNDEGAKDTVELGLQLITSFMGKSII
mmetsp:Transcript_16315/g.21358  ORF Transcript_16315/g.21358 Transcript_16315/m.21358 type:complete len:385 (-) Transcript_16315:166-1320(-)|eukprot:CAMPEP_0198144484 /NCGR_PEP_ID=MMETSP1443-20131203/16242_1 /TAXON_ID=186043 /ORGANISM="Entomoneis sp., Strain CCMP2396" /LENGTH=384 /DNA_ID=CAMNT_0043807887 /DNA_START=88 /DNA_END=1242 /DNA_ORIENTATION=+